MHPQMIKCSIAVLNGFLKKIKATYYTQRKIILTRVYKEWWFNKKTTYDFLAEKTSVERDGVPRPMD